MSCCGGSCGCGSGCKCTNCKGCSSMYPDITEQTTAVKTVISGVAAGSMVFAESEMGFEAAECDNDGCKCGANCSCTSCKC